MNQENRIAPILLLFGLVALAFGIILAMQPRVGFNPQDLPTEIYQVRERIQYSVITGSADDPKTQSCMVVTLRNGRERDIKVQISEPLQPDAFFVKPQYDKDFKCVLVRVPTIVEEQQQQKGER